MIWSNDNIIDLKKHKAFVYYIQHINGSRYIGKKNLWTHRYDKKKGHRVTREADWKHYQSSSKVVSNWHEDDILHKVILYACSTTGEASYLEIKLLYEVDALAPSNRYVNKAIGRNRYGYSIDKSRLNNIYL